MKIIVWNCNMAFRKKAQIILQHQPDIVIISECEHPDKLLATIDSVGITNIQWFGKNRNKGLAIISYNNFHISVEEIINEEIKFVVPLCITINELCFNLLAVWANNPNDPDGRYVEQVWKGINYYANILSDTKTIIAGDFNSNSIWDEKNKIGTHSDVVAFLQAKSIYSTYHTHKNQIQGKEEEPTFHLYRHFDKPYHIDYIFASQDLIAQLTSLEIGKYEVWIKYSDHLPVFANFDLSD